MMKRLLTYGSIAALFFITSCRQSEKIYIYPPSPMNDAHDFVEKYGPKTQTFPMHTSDLPKTVTLEGGTKVSIPHYTLQKNGDYIIGNIVFEALEVLKRSDIILGGLNTNHYDGSPINTKGILWADVTHDGKYVDQELLNVIKVSIPSAKGGYMKISAGNPNVNGSGFMAWGPQMIDSIYSDGSNYSFQTMKLGWMNCGVYFAHGLAYGTLAVKLENNPGTIASYRGERGNTFVYFCPKSSNVAMQLTNFGSQDLVASKEFMMPVRIDGKLVAFSIKDRRLYYAEKAITTNVKSTQSLTFEEVNVDELVARIRNLDTY